MTHRLSSSVAASVLLLAAGTAHAQTAFFSNHGSSPETPALATGAMTLNGTPAPMGFVWSEVTRASSTDANAVAGFSSHATGLTGAYRFADDFTVPGPHAWRLSSASFFAYQTDAPFSTSPFTVLTLRIWRGAAGPDEPGVDVIFGDATTNRLLTSAQTNIYRVFNTGSIPAAPPNTSRLIWETRADLADVILAPGVYWLDWQYTTADALSPAFSPPVSIPGVRAPAGANARQFRPAANGAHAGVWTSVVDAGKPAAATDVPQDLPFILRGVSACAADFNNDNDVNSQDFFDFLSAFFVSDPNADFNLDQVVNSQDFFDFLVAFFACG